MLNIIIAVLLTSAVFILFFEQKLNLKNKKEVEEDVSTSAGFIEDTYRGPFVDHFIPPRYGDIGSFVGYSGVSEDHWLHGFPHEKA
jgi:hypothetical protein